MNDEGMAPEGVYQGRVIGWGVGATEKKETPYFGVEVSVEKVENQSSGEMEEIDSFNRKIFLWLSPKAVKMTLRSLKNIGYEPEEGKELEPLFMEPDEEGAPDFFDKEVTLQMTHDEYNGQARERWEFKRGSLSRTAKMDLLAKLKEAEKERRKEEAEEMEREIALEKQRQELIEEAKKRAEMAY